MKLRVRAATLYAVLPFVLTSLPGIAASAHAQAPLSDQIEVSPPPLRRAGVPSATATVAELESQGDALRADKAFLDALDYYRAAAAKSPSSAPLANKSGIVQLQLRRWPDAKKSFQAAIRINKAYPDAHNNLGVIDYLNKDYGRAIKEYRKAIELLESSASFYNNLGTAYFARKDFPKAVASYARALELDPDVFDRSSRGGVTMQMSSPEDRAQYFYILARMYAKAGESDRSLSYLRRAMEDGYKDINKVYRDDEFGQVRKDPRFTILMAHKPLAITDDPAHN